VKLRFPKTKGRLRREAAGWLARRQGAGGDSRTEQAFHAWYDADPAHSSAFDRVSRTYREAALLRHSAFASEASLGERAHPAARQPRFALAAALALVLAVPAGLLLLNRQGQAPYGGTYAVLLTTRAGEMKRVALADGTSVTLDGDSEVGVEFQRSGRHATLKRGRARFSIAPGPQPFTIAAGTTAVRTGRGLVDAELAAGQGRIEILDGNAEVEAAAGRPSGIEAIGQGQGLASGPQGNSIYRLEPRLYDWAKALLQFDGTPLEQAAAEANRHSSGKILLARDVGQLKVSGAFKAGNNAALARSLAAAFRLDLSRTPQGDFLLSKAAPPPPEKKRGG
jgi:transmembrane sensor